jgi:hypothetical protein
MTARISKKIGREIDEGYLSESIRKQLYIHPLSCLDISASN